MRISRKDRRSIRMMQGHNKGMTDFEHESVKYSVGEYVRDQAHTNGIESFWSMMKREYEEHTTR